MYKVFRWTLCMSQMLAFCDGNDLKNLGILGPKVFYFSIQKRNHFSEFTFENYGTSLLLHFSVENGSVSFSKS